MSRSKHTRPRRILAAGRVRAPYEPRSAGDFSARRTTGRFYKRAGVLLAESSITAEAVEAPLPRIVMQRPATGHHHPLSRADIREALRAAGEEFTYGLRTVALVRRPAAAGSLSFGRHNVPGIVLLYEQPETPWLFAGQVKAPDAAKLVAAGAVITVGGGQPRSIGGGWARACAT